MEKKMDLNDLYRVNHLWEKVYPFIADQVLTYYAKDEGDVLEWGPFSGGISFALQARKPDLKIRIAVEDEDVYGLMQRELKSRGLDGKIQLEKSGLIPLVYEENTFDLVVMRGGTSSWIMKVWRSRKSIES